MPASSLRTCLLALVLTAPPALGLSMAPEEFIASRHMACVLAEQTLGQLTEDEYGERTHAVLEGFDEAERSTILAKALGYYDGLMFDITDSDRSAVDTRLRNFIASRTCDNGFRQVTHTL